MMRPSNIPGYSEDQIERPHKRASVFPLLLLLISGTAAFYIAQILIG